MTGCLLSPSCPYNVGGADSRGGRSLLLSLPCRKKKRLDPPSICGRYLPCVNAERVAKCRLRPQARGRLTKGLASARTVLLPSARRKKDVWDFGSLVIDCSSKIKPSVKQTASASARGCLAVRSEKVRKDRRRGRRKRGKREAKPGHSTHGALSSDFASIGRPVHGCR